MRRSGSTGSANTAVPTWTAQAPAIRKSSTSSSALTPPMATMGMSTTWATSYTTRSATGLSAGPDSPP